MARRRRYEARMARLREGDARRQTGPDAGAVMQLAVFAALVLIALAVAAGFRSDAAAERLRSMLAGLGPLAEPALFGASSLELGAGAAGLAAIAWLIWRWTR